MWAHSPSAVRVYCERRSRGSGSLDLHTWWALSREHPTPQPLSTAHLPLRPHGLTHTHAPHPLGQAPGSTTREVTDTCPRPQAQHNFQGHCSASWVPLRE